MSARIYIRTLFIGVAAWAGLFLAFTWIVDPYGVSPVRVAWQGINALKPKRLDIDRLIKPYEVWRYQPRTVFLGTSRIHQSIDPAMLDGTRFAPAYNASIPASSLGMNIAHLQQYVELDRNLRTVFVELFLYNFLGQGQEKTPKTRSEFVANQVTLLASANTLWDSIATLAHNAFRGRPTYEIKSGGFFYYPPGHDPQGTFAGFPAGIWAMHPKGADGFKLHEPAFQSVREMVALARAHDIELIFLATPNHAFSDCYIDSIGAWDVVQTWLTKLSAEATVYSFSQPNEWVYESVGKGMVYWNDPFHFSLATGHGIQARLAGLTVPGLPDGFMVKMTPDQVPAHVESRRQAVRRWAEQNSSFVAQLEEERRKRFDPQRVQAPLQ